ncbi:MAG: type IV pilus assembly PilZ [Ignavibacteria bacterium]|nr:MAG: type IV pilus assembly PilZ [Ignavibacteria bacterium]KAF0161751.1 MAG: type IV pilus assembly PilZ [Ignavibacteria bacterium]
MVKVKAPVSKNRLYITILGTLTLNDSIEAKMNIENSLHSLMPGFDVINDLSKFIRADDSAGTVLKEIIILLIQNGVNKIVRVVGASKAGLIQFANNTLRLEQYQVFYVPTLEDAETYLNNKEKTGNN